MYAKTKEGYGINSVGNYTDTDGKTKLTFGNANAGVSNDLQKAIWKDSSKKYENVINAANTTANGKGSYRGCAFGLVTGSLKSNGTLQYASGISAPDLFNEENSNVTGKTTYSVSNGNDAYSLQFERVGDTYTLEAVCKGSAAENSKQGVTLQYAASNLQWFITPEAGTSIHKHIWTNNFWPMDAASSYGADGHDMKFGNVTKKDERKAIEYGNMPVGDDGQDHNSFFGMHYEVDFQLVDSYIGPLEYYFFGDDDMWVFLDGELICDIGGVHSSAGSYTNLRDYIPEGDAGEHELTFFYTERGASGSTCWMQFNLPHDVRAAVDDQFMFLKTNENGKPLGNAVFGIYRDQACTDLLQTVVSDEEGSVNVTDLDTTKVYYLKEMSAPEDYIIDEGVYVVTFGEGHWSMYEIHDGEKEHLDSLVNEYDPKALPEMPETGGSGTTMIYVAGGFLSMIGIVCVFVHKKRRKYKSVVRL